MPQYIYIHIYNEKLASQQAQCCSMLTLSLSHQYPKSSLCFPVFFLSFLDQLRFSGLFIRTMSAPSFLEPNPNFYYPNLNYTAPPLSSNIIPDYDYCYQDLEFFWGDDHLVSDDFTSSNNDNNNNTFGYSSSLSQTPVVLPEKSNNSTTGSSSCSSDGNHGMQPSTNYM